MKSAFTLHGIIGLFVQILPHVTKTYFICVVDLIVLFKCQQTFCISNHNCRNESKTGNEIVNKFLERSKEVLTLVSLYFQGFPFCFLE